MGAEKTPDRNWLKIGVLSSCLALVITLTWYSHQGPGHHAGLLTAFILVLLVVLVETGILELPRGSSIPFLGVWPRLSDLVKAGLSLCLILLWTPVAMQLTPDTPVGVAIILGPDAIFLLATLVYVSNSVSKNLK
jgi:hypothetical protein